MASEATKIDDGGAAKAATLRDMFAAAALMGLMAKEGCSADAITAGALNGDLVAQTDMFAADDAARCYILADAMLAARKETRP